MRLIPPIVGLALAGIFIWMCVGHHAPLIEEALGRASTSELAGLDLSAATATAEGRDLTLTGTVASNDQRSAAATAVAAIPGVRVVNNQLEVLASSWFDLSFERGRAILNGLVPSTQIKAALAAGATTLFGVDGFDDRLTVGAVANNGWLEGLPAALGSFEDADGGLLSTGFALADNVLTLTGVVPAEGARSAIEAAASAALPELDVDNQITIVAPEERINAILELENIEFETNSDQLTPYGRQVVERVRAVLSRTVDFRIEIGGHTDSMGDDAYNLDLSRRRAATVLDTLAETLPRDNFTSRGYGETNPTADNETAEGRQRNRRIEFKILERSN